MLEFSESEILHYYEARCGKLQRNGSQLAAQCPIHGGDGHNLKISPKDGRCFCQSRCKRGWDIVSFEMEFAGIGFIDAKKSVFNLLGRPEDPFYERDVEAIYDYTDEHGETLYQVVRKIGKQFKQRHPDGRGGWVWKLPKGKLVPYHLPRLIASTELVFCVEGERDVHTLERLGLTATCNNGGAEKFAPELAPWFAGKTVAILPDNDQPGRNHAMKVAALLKPIAASVKIVELPYLPAKGDVTDFIEAGNTVEELLKLYSLASEWEPDIEFATDVPDPEDANACTLIECIEQEGGLDAFWDFTRNPGIPTPFQPLTDAMGGMIPGEIYVIGSNQGTGKTSLAIQFAIAAMLAKKGVYYFSLEMTHKAMFRRMVSIHAMVDLWRFRLDQQAGRDVSEEQDRLYKNTFALSPHNLHVDKKANIDTEYIIRRMRRMKDRRETIDLAIVDHMQLMQSTGRQKSDYEKFTAIAHGVKEAAKELDIPIILVSQTNRQNAKDKRDELQAADLRGSGAIEEDAAGIMLLYVTRAERKKAEEDPSPYYPGNTKFNRLMTGPVETILKLDKDRHGIGDAKIKLLHNKRYTRFDLISDTQ